MPHQQPVIVSAATFQEISLLLREIRAQEIPSGGPRRIWEGAFGTSRVILSVTGMGKVNTAAGLTSLIEHFGPRLVINTGCAGAYQGSGLAVGDLAVATAEIYGDEGVLTPEGWHTLEVIGIPAVERKGNRYSNEFPLSMEAAERAVLLAARLGLPLKRGKFVTVSTCSGTANRGAELFKRFGGLCETMEGAAAAHVALLYEVDCLEVRGVSNMVEDRDLSHWDIPLAVEMAQRFLLKYLEDR
jgi:futalosine hydrolase